MVTAAINLIPDRSIARSVELAALAERRGFDRCWVYDEGLATRDVYVTMAAIAAATEHLRVGPGITNPYTRHIGATAAAVASVDELSGGRAFLGIGAGGSLTLDPLGLARPRPLTAVADAIAAARALFAGEPSDLDRSTVTLSGAHLGYGRPDTEIWLAGRGPRMLALGARTCDGLMLDFIHQPSMAETLTRIRDAAGRTGNRPGISYSTMVITDDAAMAAVKPHMTYRLVDSPPDVKAAIGMTEADSERVRTAMAGGLDAAAAHVPDEWVTPFVIAGTVSSCADQLGRLVDEHDIDEFLLPVLDDEGAEQLIAAVAEVMGLSGRT